MVVVELLVEDDQGHDVRRRDLLECDLVIMAPGKSERMMDGWGDVRHFHERWCSCSRGLGGRLTVEGRCCACGHGRRGRRRE